MLTSKDIKAILLQDEQEAIWEEEKRETFRRILEEEPQESIEEWLASLDVDAEGNVVGYKKLKEK